MNNINQQGESNDSKKYQEAAVAASVIINDDNDYVNESGSLNFIGDAPSFHLSRETGWEKTKMT